MWTYENREGAYSSENYCLYIFERLIQTFEKKKKYVNRQELWLKGEKRSGAPWKDYYWGRAVTVQYNILPKAVWQPKNKQKSAAAT